MPAGGRGIDQDGNGTIDSTEGVSAAPPRDIISSRDGLRQTVVDLMQLVREIEVGHRRRRRRHGRLDAKRIYYAGQSFGGIYGTDLPGRRADDQGRRANVPGGSIIEIARLEPGFRPLGGMALASRMPSLINAVPTAAFTNFNENIPLRDQPPRGQHRGRRDGHPGGARPRPVGAAGRQPGVLRAAHPQAAAAGRRRSR